MAENQITKLCQSLAVLTALSAALSAVLWASTAPASAQETVTGTAPPSASDSVVLFQSHPYESTSTAEQHFQDNMNLKQRQDQLPLFMAVDNGPQGKKPFNWFRVNIGGYLMASEKDLNGARTATLDVSGKVQPGGGQISIDAGGEPGAVLTFALRTPAIVLSSVEPNAVKVGKKIILTGRNFSSDERQDTVLINGKPVPVLSAGPTSITALLAPDMAAGKTSVQVLVDSLESGTLPVTVSDRPTPVLTGTDFWMAPPGAPLAISGENFSTNPAKNKVYFGHTAAQIVNASENTLNVIVPNWNYGGSELNIPICVISNGVRSANAMRFDIGPKYLGALPPLPGDSSSQNESQAGSQATSQSDSQATTQANSQAQQQGTSQATNGSYQEGPKLEIENYK